MRTLGSAHFQTSIRETYKKLMKAAGSADGRQVHVSEEEAMQIAEHPNFISELNDPKRLRGWTELRESGTVSLVLLDRRADGQYVLLSN